MNNDLQHICMASAVSFCGGSYATGTKSLGFVPQVAQLLG